MIIFNFPHVQPIYSYRQVYKVQLICCTSFCFAGVFSIFVDLHCVSPSSSLAQTKQDNFFKFIYLLKALQTFQQLILILSVDIFLFLLRIQLFTFLLSFIPSLDDFPIC